MVRRLALLGSLLSITCGGAAPTSAGGSPAGATPAAPVAPAPSPEAERHYQRALELEAAGHHAEARTEVEQALAGGAGRDAALLAGKLAILRDDLDEAARLLTPLAADGKDALVLYNLGLVAQKRGRYNDARSRYLAALQADPTYAPARFNLAVLTWEAGAKDEAQHHARKFLAAAPDDPRGEELRKLILAGDAAPAPAPAP